MSYETCYWKLMSIATQLTFLQSYLGGLSWKSQLCSIYYWFPSLQLITYFISHAYFTLLQVLLRKTDANTAMYWMHAYETVAAFRQETSVKKSQGRSLTVHHNNIPTLFSPSNHTMTWLPAILVHFMKRKRTTVCFHRRCYACLITIFELILSPLFSLMWHCCLEFHSFADVSTKCVHATPCTRPCDESIL